MRAAFVALGLTLAVAASSADAGQPGRNGVIAYMSVRGPTEYSLRTIRSDGSSSRRLTGPPALRADDVTFSRDGRLMAFSFVGDLWLARADGARPRLLVRGRPEVAPLSPAFSPDGTTIAYTSGDIHLIGTDGKNRTRLVALPGFQTDPTWSPDGRRIAFTDRVSIRVFDRVTRSTRRIAAGSDPAWAPRGGLIAFSRSTGIHVMRFDGGAIRRISPRLGSELDEPAWSHDGRRIVAAGCCEADDDELTMSVIVTMDPDGGSVRKSYESEPSEPAWTAGGRVVYASGKTLWTVDGRGGKPRRFSAGVGAARSPAWSPDGRRIAYTVEEGIVIAPVGSTKHRVVAEGAYAPSWAPDGKRLAVMSGSGIDIVTLATGKRETVLENGGAAETSNSSPAWSPDGKTIAYVVDIDVPGAGRLALYDLSTRKARLTGVHMQHAPDWRPDGAALAYVVSRTCGSSECYDVRLYDLRSQRTRPLLTNANEPSWSPDGRWIAFVRLVRGNDEIWVARPDGSSARRLTHNPGVDIHPAWQPLPR